MIVYLNRDSKLLSKFLLDLEPDFNENKSLLNSPWKYFDKKHFKFIAFKNKNEISGSLVFSIQESNIHIHFIYTNSSQRGKGISKMLFGEMQKYINKDIFYITNHIRKESLTTKIVFKKLGYNLIDISNNNDEYLSSWIKKAHFFNKDLFKSKNLYAKKVKL